MYLDKYHPVAIWLIFTKLMQVLTVMEVAEHCQDNIVYLDNLLNIIELYQDITFPLSHSPNVNYT